MKYSYDNKYRFAAKFYGMTSILLFFTTVVLFILWGNGCRKPSNNESYWSKKYDSLYVVYSKNAELWKDFEEKSKGYYFLNPQDKRLVKKFDLVKFTEE